MKKKVLIILSLSLIIPFFQDCSVYAIESNIKPEITDYFTVIDKYGNPQIIDFEDIPDEKDVIQEKMKTRVKTLLLADDISLQIENEVSLLNTKETEYKIVYLNAKAADGSTSYLTYNNASNPGTTGYATGSYAKDAAYIGEFNGRIRAMQSGILMDFKPEDVEIIDYTKANISYYYEKDGYLYHKFYYGSKGSSNNYRVGYNLDYLKEDTKYYSYDGHYFYTDYTKMIDDYKNNERKHSINADKPYYNYFQYLSHRSKTTLTAQQFDKIITDRLGEDTTSKMKGLGNVFLEHQNTYGVNALLMFGVACNESAYGTSSIAKNKNNLFGHGAVDSNPYYGANGYETSGDSVKYHAEKFISNGYLDSEDWRYNGGYLGDKASGVNVRYASDVYWGEKAASLYYYNDKGLNDYEKYSLGVVEGVLKEFLLYKEPSSKSDIIHIIGQGKSPVTYNHVFIILDIVKNEKGETWYKIQTDTALKEDRSDNNWNGQYNFDRDYVYIPEKAMKIIVEGENLLIKGDVNNNKKIDAADYLMIMDTILGKYQMNGKQELAGDVNKNSKIDAADYLMIMDCILGKITIK